MRLRYSFSITSVQAPLPPSLLTSAHMANSVRRRRVAIDETCRDQRPSDDMRTPR